VGVPAPTCPSCKAVIPADDCNVATDVALCRACNQTHSLASPTVGSGLDPGVDPADPPRGAWYHDDGRGVRIGASTRTAGGFVAALLFCLFWNGLVSVFVGAAIASTLNLLGLGVPAWMPPPKMNGSTMGAGMTIGLWVFLTPFIAIGLVLLAAVAMCLAGRMEVRVTPDHGEVFTGVGPVGWRRRFDPAAVRRVALNNRRWRDSDGDPRSQVEVVIETPERTIRFGSSLTEARRRFVASALARVLVG
jgi:hypothetical protein